MMEEEEETLFDQEGLLGHREDTEQEKTEWKHKIFKTATLSMAFFCLGLCMAIPGPTLVDLGSRVKSNTDHMTFIFTARSIGYLIGSLVGGILFDFYDQQLLLFYTLALTAVATMGVPWCTVLLALSVLICMQGVAIGVLDTGGNVFCIRIWGKKSAPYMQALHFFFGVGAFLAPLIALPFLMNSGITLPENGTKGSVYPYNFNMKSLNPLSESHRLIRDLSSHHLLEQYTGGEPDGSEERTGLSYSKHFDNQYAYFLYNVNRFKREDPVAQNSLENINTTQLINVTQTFIPDANETPATLTSSTTIRAMKPGVASGDHLSPEHADAEHANDKIKELKQHPQKLPPLAEAQETTSVKMSTFNLTNESETSVSQGGTFNDPGVEFTVTNISSITTTTTATTATTSSRPTPTTTNNTSTTTATTATTSSRPTPTTTNNTSTTTATTATTSSRPTPTTTNNISPSDVVTKPPETGDASNSTTNTTSPSDVVTKPPETGDASNSTPNGTHPVKPTSVGHSNVLLVLANMSKIQFAYLVIGLLLVVNAGLFLYLYWKDRVLHMPLYMLSHEDLTQPRDSKCYITSLLILLFFFFLFYVGMEVTFGGLISTFAMFYPEVKWTHPRSATLAALFWGCLAMGRCFAIFVARWFKPPCMMVTNLLLTVVGTLILSFGIHFSTHLLWAGTVILGLGMSSLFPTTISWADSYHPLTGKTTAVFVAGSGVGEMTIPILTGYLYEKVDKMSLMYMTLTLSVLLFLLYVALQLVVRRKGRDHWPRSRTGFIRLQNSEDVADSLDMIQDSERTAHRLTETIRQRKIYEDEIRKQNGSGFEITESTKLVELND